MNKIKLALGFIVSLLMYSCTEKDEALLYDSYDFISIKGDSVISRNGLEMVASVIDIKHDTILKYTYSELNSQVTVGNNVFDVNMLIDGIKSGTYKMPKQPDYEYGSVKYKSMKKDSTFNIDYYSIYSSEVVWEDVDNKTVLLTVKANALKMINDSTPGKAKLTIDGKIRAVKQ